MTTHITILLLIVSTLCCAQEQVQRFFLNADRFFKDFVVEGKVNYLSIQQNPSSLETLLDHIVQYDYSGLTKEKQKAYLINTYNLLVINAILDKYPVASPQNIAGFFYRKKHLVNGEEITLDHLEKQLREKSNDQRLHFALVCAANDCPDLPNFAYQPEILDQQLQQQTRTTLNDPQYVRMSESQVEVNEIFQWFHREFTEKQPTIIQFINQYRQESIPPDHKLSYYPYDWSLNEFKIKTAPGASVPNANVQIFTPSVLLQKGQFEWHNFNNLYTQTSFNEDGKKMELQERQTFYTGFLQFTYGVSTSGRFNLGFDLHIVSVRYDSLKSSSPFKVFGGETAAFKRTELGYAGPRIKWNPIKKWPKFSLQSSLLFPTASSMEFPRFLAHDRTNWWTQFFYDYSLGNWQVFFQGELQYYFKSNNTQADEEARKGFLRTPLGVFISYFPGERSTVYAMIQHNPVQKRLPDGSETTFARVSHFTQAGLGGKYQVTPQVALEVSYSDFFTARNEGLGYTLNLGIRYIY